MKQRPGFTLLELMVAVAILSIVMAGLMNSFFGMRKAQGSAVSQSLLKVAGQKAMNKMYVELSQARKLIASTSLDAANKDVGREYFLQFQGASGSPAIPTALMQFPRVDENGGLGLPGVNSGELERATVGNTLVFAIQGKSLQVRTPLISYFVGPQLRFLSSSPLTLPTIRFVAYFLTEVALPADVARLPGNKGFTMQLTRWESRPYVEASAYKAFARQLIGGDVSAKFCWDWLQAHSDRDYRIAGLWDATAATAATSIFTGATGPVTSAPAGTAFQRERQSRVAYADMAPYAIGTVAYNTLVMPMPDGSGSNIAVPAYALTDTAHSTYPYGFETAIVGPSGARSVLIRLVLAARANQGLHLYGLTQQEVVKVFDQ